MLLERFKTNRKAVSNKGKKIRPDRITSAEVDCPYEHKTLESLVKGAQRRKRILVHENIVPHSPLVRMFFRTGEDRIHTPIVTGKLVSARVVEEDGMSDQVEFRVRVNAEQASQLPFLGVYDG